MRGALTFGENVENAYSWLRRTRTGRWQGPNGRFVSKEVVDEFLTPELRSLYDFEGPNGIKAVRIIPGNDKIIVIGRGQHNVDSYAEALRAMEHNVNTFSGDEVNSLWNEFVKDVDRLREINGANYMLSPYELRATSFYQADFQWITNARRRGFTIIDIGDPDNSGFSEFLSMEYNETFRFGAN